MAQLTLNVDGRARSIEIDDPAMPLLYALRDDLGLSNPRFGRGLRQCGAAPRLVAGRPARGRASTRSTKPPSTVARR